MLFSIEAVISDERPIGIGLLDFRCRARTFWENLKSHVSHRSILYSNDQALKDIVLDLLASLQLVPAARFLPSRSSNGSLSGQLALLFHQVDTGQHNALALVPLLAAVMESKPDVDIWELAYLSMPETFRASWSKSTRKYRAPYVIAAEARAGAEERRKQTQVRLEVAIKILHNLIEWLGKDAAMVVWSFFHSGVHDNIESLGEDCSSHQFSRDCQPQAERSVVLEIPELLEQILRHLPMFDLLHSQRVCRHWKEVIGPSPILQRALYFRPVPIDRKHGEVDSSLQHQFSNIFNPLLQEVFIEWFNSSSYLNPNSEDDREYVAYIPMQRDSPEIFCRPEASWRRMLFQQLVPAAQETLICFKKKSADPNSYSLISLPSDYTMGQVYDHVNKLTHIPRGDDLRWLFFLQPGSSQKPIFGPTAEYWVQWRWTSRQLWCEDHFGMEDNMKLSASQRQARKSWCERNPRPTRRMVEFVHWRLCRYTPIFRWYPYIVVI